jgi:hypothetical protein
MGNCSSTSKCNPCGPNYDAINLLATKTASYARQANTSAVNAANSATDAENYWKEFNALYLGSFASAPTVDNEGNPLQEGALYFNSVSNQMFVWQGASWIDFYFDEFTPFLATGTPTARNLVTRTADIFNVKDFGAVGDGIADDTDKIQDAIDAANANGGGTVYIPCGKYSIKSTILAKSNVAIIGDGENSELFQPADSVIFSVPSGPGPYQHVQSGFITILVANVDNVEIKNIKFDNSQLNPAKPYPSATGNNWFVAKCINAYVANNIKVTDCNFVCAGQATAFQDVDQFLIKNNHCKQQALDSEPHGDATIDHWRDITNGIIDGNFISGNTKWGILVTANTGYSGSNVKNIQIVNNKVSSSKTQSIHVMGRDGDCQQITVANNIVNSSAFHGIDITDSKNVTVIGNVTNNTFGNGIRVAREYVPFGGTGSISGTTLTITSVDYGSISLGVRAEVTATGVVSGTLILNQLTGTPGGVGTYTVNISQTVGSVSPLWVGSWRMQDYGYECVIVSGNTINNAGYLNPTTSTSENKAGIAMYDGDVNACGIVANNTVNGSTHSYAFFGSNQGVQHIGGTYKVGQAFTYTNVGSMIRFGTEGNKGIKWVSSSENNKRTEIYSTVNVDSAYQELEFNNSYTRFNQVSGSGINAAFQITRVDNSQTGIAIYPHTGSNGPIILSFGGVNPDVDLAILPKGNGYLKYGTYVNTPSAVTGYIEIKDVSGNIRKLAVIS